MNNIINTDNGVIAYRNDLIKYLQNEVNICLNMEKYGDVHSLVDVLAVLKLYSEDTLLEYNNLTGVRVIEED